MIEYNLRQTLIKFWNKAKQTFALKTELAQPDWNQNDDTQPDYVNNRTHWEEPEIYNEVFNGENLNYTTSGNLTMYQVNSNIPILSEGRHYELNIGEYNFDGICKKYENVAGSYGYYIGNGSISIQGEPDTGEDFIVYTSGRTLSSPEIMWFIMKNDSPSGEYDTLLALHEGGVHRLDKKFLPDDVVYDADIVQPDWNQNDVTSKSHILNRTHWEIPETVIMDKTFPAPGDATVFFNLDTPLIAGELYTVVIQGISSGFDTTEEIVAAGDSDGAYLINSKGLEIGYSATGFSSGYNAYYTGIGANYGEVVTITKSGELHRLDKKFLPDDVVYDDDIAQPDWNQNDGTAADYIKNRICYSETSGREYYNQSEGYESVTMEGIPAEKYPVITYDEFVDRIMTVDIGGHTDSINTNQAVEVASGVWTLEVCTLVTVETGGLAPGLYFPTEYSGTPITYNLSAQETIRKIDDKYLPKQAARVGHGLNSVEESSGLAFGESSHAEGLSDVYDTLELTYSGTNTYTLDYEVEKEMIGYYGFYDGQYYQITDIQYDDVNDISTITFDGLDVNDTIEVIVFTGALGDYSHVEGDGTIASGNTSHAEGFNTKAIGKTSHAEGNSTTASGDTSHAEGSGSDAIGTHSHAEGFNTTASGNSSHAEGSQTTASSSYSHAEGDNTIAASGSQHVFGRYNVEDNYKTGILEWVGGTSYQVGDKVLRNNALYQCKTANNDSTFRSSNWDYKGNFGTYVEIVGNGTANNSRSNARTLDWEGNEILKGNLTIGDASNTGTSALIGANSLTIRNTQGTYQGSIQSLNIISKARSVLNILSGGTSGTTSTINISTWSDDPTNVSSMSSGSGGGVNIYTEKLNLINQTSSSQGLFINTFGHLQTSGNSFTIENTGEGQTATTLNLIAQPGEGATGPGNAYLQGKGNPNSGAGGSVYVEATGSGSGGGGYLNLTASGSQDTSTSGSGGTVNITANGAGNSGGGTISITSYAGQNGQIRSGGAINISAQPGTSESSISIAADTITLNGAVKQLKKAISTSSCTPDTYYCPTEAIASLVCDDTGFTGDYNYTFSGCFTAAAGMTQMPAQTDYQSITMTWYGDIGIETGERYMFCSTKVSATEYVGVVTKLV